MQKKEPTKVRQPKFLLGQLVHHKLFGYRGVIIDCDLQFDMDDEWYEEMAKSRPSKDQPWYRVLVHEQDHETYVAEGNLEADSSGVPIDNPDVEAFFDEMVDGHYARTKDLN